MLGLSENGYSKNRTLQFFPECLMALYLGWPSAIYIVGDIPSISLAPGTAHVSTPGGGCCEKLRCKMR